MSAVPEDRNLKTLATTSAARMAPLATLPVFFKLAGKRVVVAGGTDAALWKSELLAAAGANVEVFADQYVSGFTELNASAVNGRVTLERRSWQPSDLRGAALAIGAMTEDRDADEFANACRAASIPVNVIDRPAFCDFQFGAIVNRSPLVVAISTDGGAPVFGQAIRSIIESLLPDGFRRWAEAAKEWRRDPVLEAEPAARKRTFWTCFADLAMRDAARAPTSADRVALLEAASDPATIEAAAVPVVEVGSSAETLTLAAVRALRAADVILFEDGVPPAALDFARRESERHCLAGPGKTPSNGSIERLVAANAGRRIVCLVCASPRDMAGLRDGHPVASAIAAAGKSVIVL